MPTTVRIALLAGLLALLANLAVLGFIYWRTHDEAISTVRNQVVEQASRRGVGRVVMPRVQRPTAARRGERAQAGDRRPARK